MSETPKPDIQPAEQGLSLKELSQAYAQVLQQGDDPYQGSHAEAGDSKVASSTDEDEPKVASQADDCEVTPRSILESILFVGHPHNEPLTSEQIAALMRGVQPQEIDALVKGLNETYKNERSTYTIESVGSGYCLTLRQEWKSLRDRFYGKVRDARLSQAAIDVLAIVAYHQPLTRQDVDQYRSKKSGNILRQLVRRDLLTVLRNEDKPRVSQYQTTDRFLELFGLDGLDDLPQSQDLDGQF